MLTDVYCLPGTMCDQRLWALTQQALGASVKLQHVPIPMENSIELMLEVLATALPSDPINLLGFSMGGYVACAFSIKYPERVKRLMVLSNTATALVDTERLQREVALNWIAKKGYSGMPRKKAIAILGEESKGNDTLIELIQDMDKALGEVVLVQQLKSSLVRPDLLAELEKTLFPLCFVVGNEDELLSEVVLNKIQASERYDVQTVDHCGHMLPLEQPIWLAQLILDFYQQS